jgi:CubicO group peptidase (beta-lactamase class C family)
MACRHIGAVLLAAWLAGCASPEPATVGTPERADSLDGLWEATRRFGPDVHGVLSIERRGGAWRAEIDRRSAPVRVNGRTFAFALPGQLGRFDGEFATSGDRITGHWTQPGGVRVPFPLASPVTLVERGAGIWRGEVRPLDDRMTVRLMIRSSTGSAFLRNPERNIGIFTGVSRIERSGEAVLLFGTPRGASSEETVARGRYDTDGTLVVPLRGGTYRLRRPARESGFYPRGRRPGTYRYVPPPDLEDGWPVASADQVGIDRGEIERLVQFLIDMPMDSLHAPEVHALLIARRGRLVVEEYFHGFHRDEPHDTRSAAKSLTSILVGAAIQAGAPLAASTSVHPAAREPRKRAITVEHLLTMSAGLDCDDGDPDSPGNEDRMQEQSGQPDWYRYTLDLAMVREPGDKAIYCSAQPNLLGAVLRRATGERHPALFERLVARPLGIRRYHVPLTPTGDVYMGGGIHLLPRDFLKLAQLMIDGGEWQGRRIVSREWVRRSVSPLVRIEGGGASPAIRYGYLWWTIDLPHRGRVVRAFYAAGNGGQVAMGIPELGLAIAFFAGNYSDRSTYLAIQQDYVPRHVLPALAPR